MAYRRSKNAEFNIHLRKHLAEIREQNDRVLVPPDTCTAVCEQVSKDKHFLTRLVNFFLRKN